MIGIHTNVLNSLFDAFLALIYFSGISSCSFNWAYFLLLTFSVSMNFCETFAYWCFEGVFLSENIPMQNEYAVCLSWEILGLIWMPIMSFSKYIGSYYLGSVWGWRRRSFCEYIHFQKIMLNSFLDKLYKFIICLQQQFIYLL